MIQLSSAGKRYGHKLLFEGADWLITAGVERALLPATACRAATA